MEDAEHFIGICSLRKFGLQDGSDLWFNSINLSIIGSLSLVPELFSTRCHVKNINVVEEGEGLINLFKRHILEVIIVSRDFIGESFTDNLLESVVLLSEHEDIVKSQLELVILDLIKDSFAFVVQSCSSRVKGCFKVFYLVHKEFEDVLDVFLF